MGQYIHTIQKVRVSVVNHKNAFLGETRKSHPSCSPRHETRREHRCLIGPLKLQSLTHWSSTTLNDIYWFFPSINRSTSQDQLWFGAQLLFLRWCFSCLRSSSIGLQTKTQTTNNTNATSSPAYWTGSSIRLEQGRSAFLSFKIPLK